MNFLQKGTPDHTRHGFLPIKSCKGVVIVSHGLNQNRKPFYEYGQVFSAFGYAVFTFDFAVDVRHPVVKVTAVI